MADFSRLDRYMDSLKAEYNVPGCDVSVWKDHKEIYRHWAGERHPGVPMDGTEHYFYYSVSKITTMVATLKLIEEGKLHFDDTVDKFLPAYKNLKDGQKESAIKNANKYAKQVAMYKFKPKEYEKWSSNNYRNKTLRFDKMSPKAIASTIVATAEKYDAEE